MVTLGTRGFLSRATWGLAHENSLSTGPTLVLRLLGLVSGIVIVMKFKMAAAAVKFVWLETIRNARKTSLVQDGKK